LRRGPRSKDRTPSEDGVGGGAVFTFRGKSDGREPIRILVSRESGRESVWIIRHCLAELGLTKGRDRGGRVYLHG
jgi:hypothetical protein